MSYLKMNSFTYGLLIFWFIFQMRLNAQWDLAGYYSLVFDSEYLTKDLKPVTLYEHHINISGRREIFRRTYVGLDLSNIIVTGTALPNPFFVVGGWLEYKLLNGKGTAVYPRIGISQGNMSFAGDYPPTKRPITSVILGITADIRIKKSFYLFTGYINHSPLNKIPYKYSFAQPFLGVRVLLGK